VGKLSPQGAGIRKNTSLRLLLSNGKPVSHWGETGQCSVVPVPEPPSICGELSLISQLLEVIANLTPNSLCGLAPKISQLSHGCPLKGCWNTSRLNLEAYYLPNVMFDPMSQANPFPTSLSSPQCVFRYTAFCTWNLLWLEQLDKDINSLIEMGSVRVGHQQHCLYMWWVRAHGKCPVEYLIFTHIYLWWGICKWDFFYISHLISACCTVPCVMPADQRQKNVFIC